MVMPPFNVRWRFRKIALLGSINLYISLLHALLSDRVLLFVSRCLFPFEACPRVPMDFSDVVRLDSGQGESVLFQLPCFVCKCVFLILGVRSVRANSALRILFPFPCLLFVNLPFAVLHLFH